MSSDDGAGRAMEVWLLLRRAPLAPAIVGLAAVVWMVPVIPAQVGDVEGSATVAGSVIDASTSQPVARASVSLTLVEKNRSGRQWSARTAADGRFAFVAVSAGRFSLTASASGYSTGGYRQRSPRIPGRMLVLGSGARLTGVVLRLWRNAVVSGVVRDERGEPLAGVRVLGVAQTMSGGHLMLRINQWSTSDDTGAYRLSSLTPGDYVIAVPSAPGQLRSRSDMVGNGIVFFPGVPSPSDAAVLTLAPGDKRSGVDFQVAAERTFKITGRVVGRANQAPVNLRLLPAEMPEIPKGLEPAVAQTERDGRFVLAHVPPGSYVIRVVRFSQNPVARGTQQALQSDDRIVIPHGPLPRLPPGPTVWGQRSVEVEDRDLKDIVVTLQRGASISGRVVFEGPSARPPADVLARTPVLVETADGRNLGSLFPLTGIDPDGTFRSAGLPPGKYIVRPFGDLRPWSLRSVAVGGRDVTGGAIALAGSDVTDVAVTLTDRPARVSGRVRDREGRPQPDAVVYLFPADRRQWVDYGPMPLRLRETSTSDDGSYDFADVVPGRYVAVALASPPLQAWRREATLATLAAMAVPVQVGVGQTRTMDLRAERLP